ncbi:MAG: (Fe-S)-binding protein [Candidatus Helarchaeota archaeon]|nr:(Fe-S)-binding protein [Candidatus Helarchaeota archaeon]
MSKDMIKYYYLCNVCGTCRQQCTVFRTNLLESLSPRVKVTLAGELYLNKMGITKKTIEAFFSCVLCGLCENTCPSGAKVLETIKATRQYIIEQGGGPEAITKLLDSIMENKNIFMLENEDRMSWTEDIEDKIKDKIKKEAEIALFVGCQESFKGSLYNIPESLVLIFEKAGVDFTVLGEDEWCCGAPYFLMGIKNEKVEEIMKHNIEKMKELGVKKIVAICPGCYLAWKEEYKKLDKELPFEVLHSTEIIADLIKEGKLTIDKEHKKKVVFQDPCDLARHSGVYEAPRTILQAIPGLELIELEREKADAYCCGGGGLCKVTFPDVATTISRNVVKVYIDNEAEEIITACPACFDNLSNGIEGIENVGLTDIHSLIVDLL